MEILYIWIKKYGSISSQGFNFSGEFRFHYNEENNSLNISKADNYIENFFGDYNSNNICISNVTGIIGENGAGKSTLLEFIKENICYAIHGPKSPFIIAFKDEQKNYIYHHKEIDIKESNATNFDFCTKKLGSSIPFIKEFYKVPFIFFSNIFDNKSSQVQNLV